MACRSWLRADVPKRQGASLASATGLLFSEAGPGKNKEALCACSLYGTAHPSVKLIVLLNDLPSWLSRATDASDLVSFPTMPPDCKHWPELTGAVFAADTMHRAADHMLCVGSFITS